MTGSSGELIVLGANIRTYDVAKQIWNINPNSEVGLRFCPPE
jgi:hypothetical protein